MASTITVITDDGSRSLQVPFVQNDGGMIKAVGKELQVLLQT